MPTTAIALVRENALAMRPPRALWVSYPLGRPLGAPNDAGLQMRTLRAALGLLERRDGHGILDDYPEDAPAITADEMEGMVCPVPLPRRVAGDRIDRVAGVRAEMALLAPWRQLAVERLGRTTLGVSGLDMDGVLAWLGALADGATPEPAPGLSAAQTLRFASEDLRAWHFEAASARPGPAASPAQMADWFWGETAAGTLLLAVARAAELHADPQFRAVAARTLVPRSQAHRLRP